ncbi:helix-turn-helix domain-containing protein [Microvirga tunisiensis]|uniref:Helix-turn-helix domain-containing protein n=2 Tax=Pannonibacter tanglangensis TaxID=2750084 RepID=A0ABW9ZGE5_9HYPH|nr:MULTISPECIES: IclR family transcriptional regulator [unclassified Pannonibacter]NBN63927.1 helix-turn-helix domain-containing protein [Pannonibacter sp. XCT-34]NBN77564.1 helix-turn-helix domain-containing protein [Pannonibacter sp. XCT-53]
MSEMDANGDRYRAPALDKGLDILELLSEQPSGLTRAEIVKAMGRSPSEIYRMLERLVARDYVVRSSGGDRYFLSMKLFVLANRHPPLRRLVAQATPKLDVFARDSRQSCHLVVPERAAAVVVAQASPMDSWEFRVRVGARLDLLDTGSGHALLAFQSPERRAETLGALSGPGDLQRLEALAGELDRVRSQGYRMGESGQLIGVLDISVPVLDPNGDAIAVLTCPYLGRPAGEACDSVEEALQRLRGVARELSLS